MYDLFMNYWLIGIIFVCVYQLLSFIYMKSQGDKYIYPSEEERKPILLILFMNLLLTIFYPLFIILLIIATLNYNQKEKQMVKMAEDLLKKLEKTEEKIEIRKGTQDE